MPTIEKAIYNALESTVQASVAQTATYNGADQIIPPTVRGVRIFLDITAVSGTIPTLDIKVQMKDKESGKYFDLTGATFAQKTTTGQDELIIYPSITEVANRAVDEVIPKTWRVVGTITGTTPSFTHSIGATYLY